MPIRNSGIQDARTVVSDSTARHCWWVLQPLRDHEHTIYAGRGVKPPERRDGRVIINNQGRKMLPGESPPGRGRDVGLDTRGVPWFRTRRSANSASGHRVGLSRKQLRAAIGPVGEAGPHRKNSTGRWSPRPRSASWMVRSARRPTRSEAAASTCSGTHYWRDWGSSWP